MVGTTQHELSIVNTPINVILVMEIGSGFQTINKTRNVKRIQKQITKFALTTGDLQIIST